jgi:HK97 family phage prohead protease
MRETRSFHMPLELRSGGDGRTVGGLVVPYDSPTEIREMGGSYTEVFRHGAFAKSIVERGSKVKLLAEHQRGSLPIGKATHLVETKAGLQGEFYVSRTAAGDDVLELVRDGALDSFSVGFEPIKDTWTTDRSSVERVEARLWETSLVAIPAYQDALITSLRSDETPEPEVEEVEEEQPPPVEDDEEQDARARREAWLERATAGLDSYLNRPERPTQ